MAEIKKLQMDDPSFHAFWDVPASLHPNTTSPQQRQAEEYFLSNANPFFQHARGCGFVANREGQPAGRIFASFDDNLVQEEGQLVGHFGFFECVDDEDCAKGLFEQAEQWLKEKGVTHVHGPVDLNIYTGYRVQMTGFETMPFPGEPRNPDYYPALMENAGYNVYSTWRSWDMVNQFVRLTVEHRGPGISETDAQGLKTRPARVDNLQEEILTMYDCALDVFSKNYGFATVSREEFVAAYMPLQPLLDPDLFHILINEKEEPVGFVLGYWDSPVERNRVVFHTVGVSSTYRGEAIVYHLALPFWTAAAASGKDSVGGLAKEGRTTFDRLGPATRTYSVLTKALKS
jgi:hypothetical protein